MKKFFPSCLNVSGRTCLVVGDDREALEKSVRLAQSGAQVNVIGQNFSPEAKAQLVAAQVKIDARPFTLADLRDQFLVIFCLKNNEELTLEVADVCRAKRILLCAIDQPEHCDVVNVSVYERGPLRFMLSSSGVAPAITKKIRLGLEKSLSTVPIEPYMESLAVLRKNLIRDEKNADERRKRLIGATEGFEFRAEMKLPPLPKKGTDK